jgi:hypothetical protein
MGGKNDEAPRFFRPDIGRINALLRDNLRFEVARGGSPSSSSPPSSDAGASLRAALADRGVLTVELPDGRRLSAGAELTAPGSRRDRLLALAACLAECAMSLGLGAGVYSPPALRTAARAFETA